MDINSFLYQLLKAGPFGSAFFIWRNMSMRPRLSAKGCRAVQILLLITALFCFLRITNAQTDRLRVLVSRVRWPLWEGFKESISGSTGNFLCIHRAQQTKGLIWKFILLRQVPFETRVVVPGVMESGNPGMVSLSPEHQGERNGIRRPVRPGGKRVSLERVIVRRLPAHHHPGLTGNQQQVLMNTEGVIAGNSSMAVRWGSVVIMPAAPDSRAVARKRPSLYEKAFFLE